MTDTTALLRGRYGLDMPSSLSLNPANAKTFVTTGALRVLLDLCAEPDPGIRSTVLGMRFALAESPDTKRELEFKEDGQEYAQIMRMLGNGRCEAYCFDGKTRLAGSKILPTAIWTLYSSI